MGKTVPGDLEAAVQAYVGGLGAWAAARQHHVSEQRLGRALRARGLLRHGAERRKLASFRSWQIRHAAMNLPDQAELVARYEAGTSVKALAGSYGLDRVTITSYLKKAGVQMRTMSEQQKIEQARLTPEQRRANAAAANMAARGRTLRFEEQCKRARTRQERGLGVSPYELLLREWLTARGVASIPQQAIGPYNADLGLGSVVVELHGGGWHGHGRHHKRGPKRLHYLRTQGYNVAIVWVDGRRWPLTEDVADALAAFAQEAQAGDLHGRYRIYGGDGRVFSPGDHAYERAVELITEPG
jgi:hypothetical protein